MCRQTVCVIDDNALPRRKSNSETTCWGGKAGDNPSGDGQSDTVESRFVNAFPCYWMTDRVSVHLMSKSTPVLLLIIASHSACALAQTQKWITTALLSPLTSQELQSPHTSSQRSHSQLNSRDTPLTSYHHPIVAGLEQLHQISGCYRYRSSVSLPVCPRHTDRLSTMSITITLSAPTGDWPYNRVCDG